MEKQIADELDLFNELRDCLLELTFLGDNVLSIDISELNTNQLESINVLSENLRQLKPTVENLERKLHISASNLVKRAPTPDNLSSRLARLQQALNQRKEDIVCKSKIQELTQAVDLISATIQIRTNELEHEKLNSTDEYNLIDLETKKHQLEDIIEKIPEGDEALALREQSSLQLGFLNDLLKCLAAKVGNKLAALTRFNAAKDEIDAQLCSIDDNIEDMHSDSVPLIDENLNHIQVIFCKLLKSYFFFSFLSYFFYISCSIFRIINSSFFF